MEGSILWPDELEKTNFMKILNQVVNKFTVGDKGQTHERMTALVPFILTSPYLVLQEFINRVFQEHLKVSVAIQVTSC